MDALFTCSADSICGHVGALSDSAAMRKVAEDALRLFVQANYTGPQISDAELSRFLDDFGMLVSLTRDSDADVTKCLEYWNRWHLVQLSNMAGEDVYRLGQHLFLLGLAIDLFGVLTKQTEIDEDAWLWYAKSLFLLQRFCDNASEKLQTLIYGALDRQRVIYFPDVPVSGDNVDDPAHLLDLTQFKLFDGLVSHYYMANKNAYQSFKHAQSLSGLQWDVTGVPGRRTKFQEFDITQLVVRAISQPSRFEGVLDTEQQQVIDKDMIPQTLTLDDDLLLDEIKLSEDAPVTTLHSLDQAILLAFCLNVKNSNPAHGLTTEQMMPFVRLLIRKPTLYLTHGMALLLRSRLESTKSRTVERALFQLQVLVDQFSNTVAKSPEDVPREIESRSKLFWQLLFPALWELKKEFGQRLVSLGVLKSAIEVFQPLEMWEEIINCYVMMDEKEKAEELILKQLETEPDTPKLLCILGDLRKDPELWQKAWDVSGCRYARAMRSLGSYYYKSADFLKAIECYQKALSINALFENSWFTLGCAAMQVENWDEAQQAFMRCVMLESGNGEAWNNLAAIYIKQQRKTDAFRCLREGLKEKFENWKMWENYLFLALELREFSEAISAMDRLLGMKWKEPGALDKRALRVLMEGTVFVTEKLGSEVADEENKPAVNFRILERVRALLEKIASIHTTDSEIWTLYADFEESQGRLQNALDGRISAYRALNQSEAGDAASSDKETFEQLAKVAITLGKDYIRAHADRRMPDALFQARLVLRNLIKRTKEVFENTPLHDELKKLLAEVSNIDKPNR